MNDVSANKIALVAIENCTYSFDRLFSFLIPQELANAVVPGVRVLVPFGRGNVKSQGFVLSLEQIPESTDGFKYISSVLDDEPLLSEELCSLAIWIRDTCFCTYFLAAKALLPGGMCLKTEKAYSVEVDFFDIDAFSSEEKSVLFFLKKKNDFIRESAVKKAFRGTEIASILRKFEKLGYIKSDKFAFSRVRDLSVIKLKLSENYVFEENCISFTDKQKKVIEFLTEYSEATVKEISYYTGVSTSVIKGLVDKEVCVTFEDTVLRTPLNSPGEKHEKSILSKAQNLAYHQLLKDYKAPESKTALLFGVTGSGKTSVYLELIDRVIEDGKTALVLVPEISLTPQTMSLFSSRYGEAVAVLHSGLSIGERHDEWKRIKQGKARVVIGTRSAVFAPLNNIGVIIIDEEQEHTYKSEMSPRYNAKEVARFRSVYHNALLLLASATPSVETYAKAVSGKISLCELSDRYGNAVLPEVITVDMTDKEQTGSFSAISTSLAVELQQNLDCGEQSILLINRRGYNTFVVCKACKNVITCPKCSISLTYHSANSRLMCHYCGYSTEYADACPKCGDKNIRYSGFGTQRIEQELKVKFPSARILRMDADTTTAKNSHDKAFSAFSKGEYDIMLGTQMVAKGLDFPNVTLVGVASADNELYSDDFRCNERSFDLLTQVVGRAGRGNKKGRAVIQTVSPDNTILDIAARQDYKAFFNQEIIMRKAMIYPPFCDICVVGFSSSSQVETNACAKEYFEKLKLACEDNPTLKLIVLGPISPRVSKINDSYRQRIIIKCKNSVEFRTITEKLLKEVMNEKKYKKVSIFADINPENADI